MSDENLDDQVSLIGLTVKKMEENITQVLGNMTKQLHASMEKMSAMNTLLEEALKRSIKISLKCRLENEEKDEYLLKYAIDYTCKGYLENVKEFIMVSENTGPCFLEVKPSEDTTNTDSKSVEFASNEYFEFGSTNLRPDKVSSGELIFRVPRTGEDFIVSLKLVFPHPAMEGDLSVEKKLKMKIVDQMIFTKVRDAQKEDTDDGYVISHTASVNGSVLRNVLRISTFDSIEIPSMWSASVPFKVKGGEKAVQRVSLKLLERKTDREDGVEVKIGSADAETASRLASSFEDNVL